MAFLIPENLRNSKGIPKQHRRVATALAVGLDDASTVWFEPMFDPDGTRPDFVVLDPSIGVVVIVVFEQSDDQSVLGAVRGQLRIDAQGKEQEVGNPIERASDFGNSLLSSIATNKLLRNTPVGGVAAFPYLLRSHAEQLGLDSVVDLEQSLFKEDIDQIVRGDGEALLVRCLTRALEGGLAEPLEDEAQDQLRGLIHPEVLINAAPTQPSLFVAEKTTRTEVFKVMDRKQEAFAKGLGSGHRIIRGVAGSGKTLILIQRARLLARLLPGKPILVTCYTKSLAGVLESQLKDCPNVQVKNLDSVMSTAIRSAGLEHPGYPREGSDPGESAAAVALRAVALKPPPLFRAVLVDEAQDFDTDALKFCVALAEVDANGEADLLIVADSAQNIFRRKFTWSEAGIKASGRTSILRKNYRNTQQILRFAQSFLLADSSISIDEAPELQDEMTIIPAESAERTGKEPTVTVVADTDAEVAQVLALVESKYSANLPARSLAVLLLNGTGDNRARRIVEGLSERDLPVFWVSNPDDKSASGRAGLVDEPIIVSSIHSAKGLEFPVVILCGVSGGHGKFSRADLLASRKTVYVGCTRALEELHLVATPEGSLTADLSAALNP